MSGNLNDVSDVEIDEGLFKYILIKVISKKENKDKFIVRGFAGEKFPYHGDILDAVEPKLASLGLSSECVGGGRIRHNLANKSIEVYGYSQGYGKADHRMTCDILKTKYPEHNIKITTEGY